jgi:quaternary ammonium compound-resistance protein SugE
LITRGHDLPRFGTSLRDGPDHPREVVVAWIYLLLAGILEVVWAFAMKQSDGFTKLVPTTITAVALLSSLALLAMAMRSLPLGTAYAVWTGIGAVGALIVGVIALGEPMHALRATAAAMILGGLVLMKLA